ncbi:MAG: histidinol-phosphatase HisJ [Proteobacteria bacterium]|nr:histidinol-phosphatase HisJ [Pseudomonadota bacterium]MBU1688902.1 histidinol-phosphatase HisJ [Pseudomonadota bacterium]
MIDLKSDGHIHTSRCHHAVGSMEDYVQVALARGLEKIVFLEHLEVGIRYFECTWLEPADFDDYFQEGRFLQKKYHNRIEIGLGVEVGFNPDGVDQILALLAQYPFERIGLSYHFMEVDGGHHNLVSRKATNIEALGRIGVDEVVRRYFATMLEAVTVIPGDVVCHLDAVMRYHPELRFTEENNRQIRAILQTMAEKEMALEVNASGVRMEIRREPFPARWIVEQALSMNIPLIAGSDAHRPEDVGRIEMLGE